MTIPLQRTSELYMAAMTPPQVYACLKAMQTLLWNHGFAGACLVISPDHHAFINQLPRGLVIRGDGALTIENPAVHIYEARLAEFFRDFAMRTLRTAMVLEQSMPWKENVYDMHQPSP